MSGRVIQDTSAERRLVGALCRPTDAVSLPGLDLQELGAQIGDWPHLVHLLRHHKLVPLAARNACFMAIAQLPPELRSSLQASAAANAHQAFRYLAVLQGLMDLFGKAGIPVVVLKGVWLAVMAHGDVAARDVGDIDLLIDPSQAVLADEVLRASGRLRKEPAASLTPKRASFYVKSFKDFTYDSPGDGFEVDLHWRLLRDSHAAAAILPSYAPAYFEEQRIGSLDLTVLKPERTLLFLAVHGAMENWARWKTLADVAALWQKDSSTEHSRTWAIARSSGTTAFLAAALLLAGRWFGMASGLEAEERLKQEDAKAARLARAIVARAQQQMRHNGGMPSPMGQSTFAMKRLEASLHSSAGARMELARRVLFRPRIWQTFDLPDRLFFLYPLMSPVEWLLFRARNKVSRRGTS